jgi:hypothetical protein
MIRKMNDGLILAGVDDDLVIRSSGSSTFKHSAASRRTGGNGKVTGFGN